MLAWLQPYKDQYPTVAFDFDGDWHLFTKLLGHQYPTWLTCLNVYQSIEDLAKERFFVETGLQGHHALNDARANMAACRVDRMVR